VAPKAINPNNATSINHLSLLPETFALRMHKPAALPDQYFHLSFSSANLSALEEGKMTLQGWSACGASLYSPLYK
jgi:hypothetical protein